VNQWCEKQNLKDEPSQSSRYLGAQINPKSVNCNDHIKKRIQKAHGTFYYMKKRGLASGKIHPRSTLHIFKTLIVPSLMYGMEAMPMSKSGLDTLDYFMASSIETLLYGEKCEAPASWILWEAGCLPAETLLNMATIRLHNRMKKLSTSHSIAKKTLASLKDNFFDTRVQGCQSILDKGIMEEILSTTTIPKMSLNITLKENFEDWHSNNLPLSTQLEGPTPTWLKPGIEIDSCLLDLPAKLRESSLKARARACFDPNCGHEAKKCYLCAMNKRRTYQHLAIECKYIPIATKRNEIDTFMLLSPLAEFWKDLDNDEKTTILLLSHWDGNPELKKILATKCAMLNQEILQALKL
jgi:hypothetical protein